MSDSIEINQPRALGIGDALVDLSTYASQLPPLGGNIWSTAVTMSAGGTTNNVATGIARLGVGSIFVGSVGSDPYGQYLVDQLNKVGVDTHGVLLKQDAYTGIVLTIINDTGERTFIACAKGAAHSRLTGVDVRGIDIEQAETVHTTGVCLVEEPSRQSLLSALRIAHEAEKTVYFDPNLRLEGEVFPDALREAEWAAIQLSNVVMLSEEELALLCPVKTVEAGADALRRSGVEVVVVKRGMNGAEIYSQDGKFGAPAFQVDVFNTAGAGDAFNAGFIAARLRQASLRDALLYANAVAAIKVTRKTAQDVPSHQEVLSFLTERNHRVELR